MTGEQEHVRADPFLDWVQAAIANSAADQDAKDELAELRNVADEIERGIAHFRSSDADEMDSNVRFRGPMDPRWLERWLNFDVDIAPEHPQRANGRNSALIDNTTVDLVADCVEHQHPPSALGMLDLANFVNNLVLRDKLFVLDQKLGTRQTSRQIGQEVRRPDYNAPSDTAILGAALLWIRQLARADNKTSTERADVARTWSVILGASAPSSEKMFAVRLEDALYYVNAIRHGESDNLTQYLINVLFEAGVRPDRDEQLTAVQAANCRALLNLEAGRHYDLPYAGGITRLPIKRLLWQRGRQGDAMLAAIDKANLGTVTVLDNAYRQRVAQALMGNQQKVVLPVFLAAALSRINHLDEFYECTDDLRQQAKPLRRRLVAIEQALDSAQPQEEIEKLLVAFAEDTRLLRRTVWDLAPAASGAAGVVLTAATGQPWWLTASLAALTAAPAMQNRTWKRLANRVMRRDLWFITELRQVTSGLLEATPRLEQLWGNHFRTRKFGAQLDRLRALETL